MSPSRRSVIVFGADSPIGLSLVRELGRAGYRVIGVGRSSWSIGLRSRFCHQRIIRASAPDLVIAQLCQLGEGPQETFLVSVGEANINLVNGYREQLSRHLSVLDPTAEQMAKVLDKAQTLALAESLGIEVPQSWPINAAADIDPLAERVAFPVVLKWANPHEVVAALRSHGLSLHKLEYCLTAEEFRTALHRYDPVGTYPLVQQYCGGHGLGQFFLCDHGRVVRRFQHERLHEWPPEGGTSTLCKSVPLTLHADCMGRSEALLAALQWHGVAMVEYRYDPVGERYVLMEINGRFWGSVPLAEQAGVGFASNLVRVLGEGLDPLAQVPRMLQCRYWIPDTKRLLRILLNPEAIRDPSLHFSRWQSLLGYLKPFFDPRCRYFVWQLRDPMPLLADVRNIVFTLWRRGVPARNDG